MIKNLRLNDLLSLTLTLDERGYLVKKINAGMSLSETRRISMKDLLNFMASDKMTVLELVEKGFCSIEGLQERLAFTLVFQAGS
jgi:hypothetical protein